MKHLLAAIPFLCLLSGCTVTQQIDLANDRYDGTVRTTAFFRDVAEDFDSLSREKQAGQTATDRIMIDIREALLRSSGTGGVSLTRAGDGAYRLSFAFDDIATLLENLGSSEDQDILTSTGNDIVFHLDQDNYPELEKAIPLLADENFQSFGPRYNQDLDAEEYKEMLAFMLGDDAPDALDGSTVTVSLTTPAPIVYVWGMEQTGTTTATFSFPLIDLLLLHQPIDAAIEWE